MMDTNDKRPPTNVDHFVYFAACLIGLLSAGCATAPPAAVGASATAAQAAPMTLPRYLGVDTLAHGVRRTVYRSRLRVSHYVPALEPGPAAAAPIALSDPACLASPAPAVAVAASMQQADAAAPAKVKALEYLATIDCSRNPQVEEALLAALGDPTDSVRLAATKAISTGMDRCNGCGSRGLCGSTCNRCGTCCTGCCTQAIHAQLNRLAYDKDDKGCHVEPNPSVRRLARLALARCPNPIVAQPAAIPEEMPAPEVLQGLSVSN